MPRTFLIAVVALLDLACFSSHINAGESVDYGREVKPLLAKRCYACHGALHQKGGLRLDTAASIRRGGESGPALSQDSLADSLLLQAITGTAGFRMPPAGEGAPLTDAETDLIRRWLKAGAPSPADETPQVSPEDYWSYRTPVRSPPPSVETDWPRGPVDAFVAAEHVRLGLTPRQPAAREVWLRRVYLDLAGIPPTPEELDEFLADELPDAAERVVDRLLARPDHGERWGRHWMDVWRYSDWYGSRGINEIRYSQRHIWRWRDWIVRSLNHDRSYGRMIEEMLAGDEIDPANPETLAATGFLGRNWYKFDRNVWMFDAIEQTSQAFLAVTMKCARCHDHKYDPLTQQDYYRFRAVFEPHDVRTDRISAKTETEKDATLGQVLKDGVARIYDKKLDAPTYVFERGDSRYPDEKKPLAPAVPAVFRAGDLAVTPRDLPLEAYYPALRPQVAEGLIADASDRVAAAQAEATRLASAADAARAKVEQAVASSGKAAESVAPAEIYATRFLAADQKDWKPISGQWIWEHDRLVQKQVGSFATIVLDRKLPQQFTLRLKYRPLPQGALRSIGLSYDYLDQGNSQDIYTSTNDARQTLQAFHRLNGQQHYPSAGTVSAQLKVGVEAVIEARVRGNQLSLALNGESKLEYVLPVPRREGKFTLWVHEGTAEFLELNIAPLETSLADLKQQSRAADHALAKQRLRVATAQAQAESLAARLAAERLRLTPEASADQRKASAEAASRAQAAVAVAQREEELLDAEYILAELRLASTAAANTSSAAASATAASTAPALTESEKKVAAARAAVDQAKQRLGQPDGQYEPVGETFPAQSTGRRAALASWMVDPRHPRTARVAVNHVWLRHFGQALVPSVANFGLNGDQPSHPALLDWLAVTLVEGDWRMKTLHRDLVLSATYRQSSAEGSPGDEARRIDPTNRYLWRMNSRRMEAEVVRDSVLAIADQLDRRQGGPELPESSGQTVPRRSLYFRLTPNEKMRFLETFDAADPNGCFRRRESVVPQQALVLMNSALALEASRQLAADLTGATPLDDPTSGGRFIELAFARVLGRKPTATEAAACVEFLESQASLGQATQEAVFPAGNPVRRPPASDVRQRAREDLVHVLYNHNDFVTIR
jgi:hypothetical protein